MYLYKQQQVRLTERLPYMNLTKIQKSKLVAICVEVFKEKTHFSLTTFSILNYTLHYPQTKNMFMG